MNFSAYKFKLNKKKSCERDKEEKEKDRENKQARNNLSHLKLQI